MAKPPNSIKRKLAELSIIICGALCLGCTTPDPNLVVVPDKAQLGGRVGMYWDGTIFLAPGASWEVLEHELMHHRYGNLGEAEIK